MAGLPRVTVRRFVEGLISPLTIDTVFQWPPDVFAVTSALLRRTGAYRYVVSPPGAATWPPALGAADYGWTKTVGTIAEAWIRAVADQTPLSLPPELSRIKHDVTAAWETITLEDLRDIDDEGT